MFAESLDTRAANPHTGSMTHTRTDIEWQAQQTCGQCGIGAFQQDADYGYGPVCDHCEHVHDMRPWNLDPREAYTFVDGTLWVVCYAEPTDPDLI